MQDRIKAVMGQIFNVDPATIENHSSPETIERWDSLRHMQLVLAIEDEFDVRFADEDIPELLTLQAIENKIAGTAR